MNIKDNLHSIVLCLLLCGGVSVIFMIPQSSLANHFKVLDSIHHHPVLSKLPEQIKPYFLSKLSFLYEKNDMQPLWQDPLAIQQFEQQLLEVALLRINPQFSIWREYLSDPKTTGMARDIILSDAMLGYLSFISSVTSEGKIWLYSPSLNAERGNDHMMLVPDNQIALWQEAIDKKEIYDYLHSLEPQHPQYRKMQAALLKLLSDKQPWPKLTQRAYLREGQSSQDIPNIKKILLRLGIGNLSLIHLDSQKYTHDVVMAIKQFQKNRGLSPDGVIGLNTRTWLNISPEILARLLAINMQRLRFTPADIEIGILVNIPNYSLNYYEEGEKRLDSKVIVGRPEKKTPIMHSVIHQILINPHWNVPHSLAKRDILPRVLEEIDYLRQNNYLILSSWSKNAQIIDPESIDWENVSIENFPYQLRQKLGPKNSLGHYKFNMLSPDAIFLHDTPNKVLFHQDMRALSSGCVRVEKAAELAHWLLKKRHLTDSDLSNLLAKNKSTYLDLHEHIPVRLYYLTAWISEDEVAQFRTDIYDYDKSVF